MMKGLLNLCIVAFFFLFSCEPSREEKVNAMNFLDSLEQKANLGKPEIEKLNKSVAASIIKLRYDRNAAIDIKSLEVLRNDVLRKNAISLKNMKRVKEFDNDINLRRKLIINRETYHKFCNTELLLAIQIFASNSEDRFEKAKQLIVPKGRFLKETSVAVEEARKEFINKYE